MALRLETEAECVLQHAPLLGLSSGAGCRSSGRSLWRAFSGRTAFGFLHLTRSPRHGMHSSARHRAFWMPEKQQLVRVTDAKRGHGFHFSQL